MQRHWPRPVSNFGAGWNPPRWSETLLRTRLGPTGDAAMFPGTLERLATGAGERQPFWHVIDYALTARGSGNGEAVENENFTLLHLTGSTDQTGLSFRSQFYQVLGQSRGIRMSRIGVNYQNMFGTAQRPFYLGVPYNMPNLKALLNKVGDLSTNANNVQIVLFGVKDYGPRRG